MRFRIVLPKARVRLPVRPPLKRLLLDVGWFVGAAGLVSFAFGVSFYLAMRSEMRSTEVEVPDFGGLVLEEADGRARPLDLVLEVVDQRNDPAVPSGRVLQQVPPAGVPVRRGRKIKLVLSLGGKVLNVPDTIGAAARAVEIVLRQEGFVPGDEAHAHSTDVPSGVVMAQVPSPDTPAVPNTRVHRLVSSGPPPATWVMPDLSGLRRSEAEQWITRSGFRRGRVRQVSMSGRPPGTVVGQLPLAGYPVRSKDIVELTVAR